MIAQVRSALRFLIAGKATPPQTAKPVRSRRRRARAAVWSGFAAFVALTAGVAVALETVKPQWRDPEFAVRLKQLQNWKAKAPDRPLVVAFGSSRTQMGLAPAAMGFADAPGSPLVYNCGYRSGRSLVAWLNLRRLLDAGVKPDAVLIQLAALEVMVNGPADRQYRTWGPRLSLADQRRWAAYIKDPAVFQMGWLRSRGNLWETYRGAIRSELLPNWQTYFQRLEFTWEMMDNYGFAPSPFVAVPDEVRRINERNIREIHGKSLAEFAPTRDSERLVRDLVELCRQEGIPVVLFWAPESPTCRTLYTPASRAAVNEFSARLAAELNVCVFPAPEHLVEADFADGFHLLKSGAEKYSRWLAEQHLKPWLEVRGLSR